MSFNSFLLSLFANKTRFRGDVTSMSLRFQTLSIIYINLGISGILLGVEIATWWHGRERFFPMTPILTSLVFLSLWSLRHEKYDLAAATVVIYMHLINFSTAAITDTNPLGAIPGLLMHPTLGFFLGSGLMTRILNIILSMTLITHHVAGVQETFKITLTDEQARQVEVFIGTAFISMAFLCFTTFIQKSLETDLWDMVRKSYEKSEKLTTEVVQAAEAKDKFISSLSHEIRNPLNALKGSIDYLLTVIQGQKYLKVLESAKLSADILINLANNVLDAAKLRSEKMDVSYMKSNFNETVKKVLAINTETLKAKRIVAEASIDRVLTKRMWMDPSRLLQILMNLVSNALKFTPEGGKIEIKARWYPQDCNKEKLLQPTPEGASSREVRHEMRRESRIHSTIEGDRNGKNDFEDLCCEEFNPRESARRFRNFELLTTMETQSFEEKNSFHNILPTFEPWTINYLMSSGELSREVEKKGYLKVEVSDSGCGIAPENISKLFEMFVQAHESVNNMHGGTGLGLWICKQLCQKMGGDIKLYSELNKGTTFLFYIPINNDRQERVANQGQNRENVNVMVVDDYSHNRDLHKLLLEREGARVIVASNGREAVEKYKNYDEGHFDCIMMDVLMPEIDGFEAAKMIRKWEIENNRRKKVDICFVSGEYFDEEAVMKAFKSVAGVEEETGIRCLKKPIDIEMIRQVVEEYKNGIH